VAVKTELSESTRSLLLAAILLMSLVVRVGWGLRQSDNPATLNLLPDQQEYVQLAYSLGMGQTMSFVDPRFDQRIYAYRTPGYPVLVWAAGSKLHLVRIVQALLDTSTILAMYLLARRWLSAGPSLLAAVLVGLDPFLVYFSGLLLSETLFTALLARGAVGLIYALSPPSEPGASPRIAWGWLLLGVIAMGLAAMVRPSALLLAIILPLALPTNWKRRLLAASGAIIVLLALFVPWAMRNQSLLGRAVATTTNGGITLYDGFHPGATGASDQSFTEDMPLLLGMNELQRDDYFRAHALQFIRENPRESARLAWEKLKRTWSPVPLSQEFGRPLYQAIGGAYALPLYLLLILGLLRCRIPLSAKLFLITPAIYFSLVHMLSVGSLRYRVPVEPLLCVIAASAFALRRPKVDPNLQGATKAQRHQGSTKQEVITGMNT
jgi:4-amino-4-deoxy-L-arabinose transferase-like glycosyltransferase